MKHGKSSRALLPFLALLMLFSASKAFPQAGGGSKGGVVLACFTSDPTKFLVESRPTIYTWPSVNEDPTDPRVGYASKARIFDAVNRLKFVQVAEYFLATTYRSWGGSEDLFGNGVYRLHPLLYAINDLPASKKAVPEPRFPMLKGKGDISVLFPREKLQDPAQLTNSEVESLFNYVEAEETRIKKDRDSNTPIFEQIYFLVASMFRGVPGFYVRLQAAHDKLGLIPNHESNVWGSYSDQWDSRNLSALTSLPKPPENCQWMTAADRIGEDIIYDRYLWHRMDLFQRALLQLHEEIYYLGSDARGLGLYQGNVEPTRYVLSHFLRGERTKEDLSGDFASTCAYYDSTQSSRAPTVKLQDSMSCQVGNGQRSSIKGLDSAFLPASVLSGDGTTFVSQFLCANMYVCSQEMTQTWEKVARYYGPYSSSAMQAMLASEKAFFGRYSTIDRLVEKRNRAFEVVNGLLAPYEVLYGFCDKAGYLTGADVTGPTPRNNPRRLEKRDREKYAKRQQDPRWVAKPDEPVVTRRDLEEFGREDQTFRALRKSVGNAELLLLNQQLGLLNDFPDFALSGPLGSLLLLKTPASFADVNDLEPNKGKNEEALQGVCKDVSKRRRELVSEFLELIGSPQAPILTFYDRPEDAPVCRTGRTGTNSQESLLCADPLDIRVPR